MKSHSSLHPATIPNELIRSNHLSQTVLSPSNFIYPIFVHDGEDDIPIKSMPGQARLGWKSGMIKKVREARAAGVNQVVVFPKTPDDLKSATAEESFNPNGLAQRSISLLKDTFPDLEVYTDVALDPYNTMGHDGMVRSDGVIMNDETVYYLCKQAVSQARAGADVISPSDMMDGRVGAIRDALDAEGFTNVAIMSYTAKYVIASPCWILFFSRVDRTCFADSYPPDITLHITVLSETRSLAPLAQALKNGGFLKIRRSIRWILQTSVNAFERLPLMKQCRSDAVANGMASLCVCRHHGGRPVPGLGR